MNKINEDNIHYYIIDKTVVEKVFSVTFFIKKQYIGIKALSDLYSCSLELEGDLNEKSDIVSVFFSMVPTNIYSFIMSSYHKGIPCGFNDVSIASTHTNTIFYFQDETSHLDTLITDKIFNKLFTNYYWYMESLGNKYHPEWYPKFVETFNQYYPHSKNEIDSKEKLDLSSLIKYYSDEKR